MLLGQDQVLPSAFLDFSLLPARVSVCVCL